MRRLTDEDPPALEPASEETDIKAVPVNLNREELIESFKKILKDNDWESSDGVTYSGRGALKITLKADRWQMEHEGSLVCEGTFAQRAYAVIESAMETLGMSF